MAHGGTFTVKNCVDEVWFSSDATYVGGSRVQARRCIEAGGRMHLNGRAGHSKSGEYGAWVWKAPSGSGILSAAINARLRASGGWYPQLLTISHEGAPYIFGTYTDGQFQKYGFQKWEVGNDGAKQVTAQLGCYRSAGCDLNTLGGATNQIDSITLTIYDWTDPSVSASGPLITNSDEWHRGSESVSVHAADSGSGVAGWGFKVDKGSIAGLSSQSCGGDKGSYAVEVDPCPSSADAQLTLDSAAIGEGTHTLSLCAHDYGTDYNWGCSPPHTVKVDNDEPLQPANLEVAGGEEVWHPDPHFTLNWANPDQGNGAPLSRVRYRVLDEADAEVVRDSVDGHAEQLGLDVPDDPGEYTVEVWLEDAAGNQGAPARAVLRFDDLQPQAADPVAPQGWLSRTDFPYFEQIGHPEAPLPVSGIAGYAVSVDRLPDADPCEAPDRCQETEVGLHGGLNADTLEIPDLPEGTNFVHSVAVSGSGMKSERPGRALLRVDKTDPVTTLSGAPKGWASEPLALTVTASDSLSGMEPGAEGDGLPYTAIRVDGGTPVVSAGDEVTTALVADGVHTVDRYARDLAGNVNDGGTSGGIDHASPLRTIVRIDRTAPEIAFAGTQDPDDPELIVARVADSLSGTDGSRGTIAVRRTGSAEPFQPLATASSSAGLRARWDSDSYPAGEYEFRATGYDAAGNAITSSRRAGGGRMVLPNPLKLSTALRTGFGGRTGTRRRCHRVRRGPRTRRGRRRCTRVEVTGFNQRPRALRVAYGRGARISGRLSAGLGTPLADMPVRVIERFPAGAHRRARVTTVHTADDGVFTAILRPGPTRTVEARFDGTRTLTHANAKPARLRVRGGLRLRVRPRTAVVGGRPIVFYGRVPSRGASIPPDGKSVQLQYRLPGLPWEEFRTVQTNRLGVFKYRYRFSDSESRGITFYFRAYAPRQSSWPYAPGPSNRVAVRAR